MNKKSIIILSFLSAIFSLIYVLSNYFGWTRYFNLYISPIEKYINNYKNLEQVNDKKRVVVSISPTPDQLHKIEQVIKSILDQTVRVDLIYVVLPYGKDHKLDKKISKKLEKTVTLFRTSRHYGKLISLIPIAMKEGESNTQIITLGADKIYGEDFIETLLDISEKYPDNIISSNSHSSIEGTVFNINLFEESFFNIPKYYDKEKWFGKYFSKVPKKNINYKQNYRCL